MTIQAYRQWKLDRVNGTDAYGLVWSLPALARSYDPEGMRARLLVYDETNAARERYAHSINGGEPRQLESLERTLANVSFRMEHVRFIADDTPPAPGTRPDGRTVLVIDDPWPMSADVDTDGNIRSVSPMPSLQATHRRALGTPFEAVVFIDMDAVLDVDVVVKAIHAELTLLPAAADSTWADVVELPHGLEVRFNGRKKDPRKFVQDFVKWIDAGFRGPSRGVAASDIASFARHLNESVVTVGFVDGRSIDVPLQNLAAQVRVDTGEGFAYHETSPEVLAKAAARCINDGMAKTSTRRSERVAALGSA